MCGTGRDLSRRGDTDTTARAEATAATRTKVPTAAILPARTSLNYLDRLDLSNTHVVGRQEGRYLELGLVLRIYGDLVEVGPRARGGPEAGPSGGEPDALPLLLRETPLVLFLGANLPAGLADKFTIVQLLAIKICLPSTHPLLVCSSTDYGQD